MIEPGLTGIVGPNGCGKSNVLEALRWVMGANSAKAMRGQGMDDVIFAGTASRPSRNHAEVTLTLEDALGTAPAPFQDAAVLEVSRRIDRGAGSTYRINGKEVRARDVQLLFADSSTGANSPALVRQGQISELIAAKPQNRRRILEEAGGVAGLHTRRHEAELRLRAAETNLERLDDIARELESALSRLKREARQAEKYRKITTEIRALQSALIYTRWLEAQAAAEGLQAEVADADARLEQATREVARLTAAALTAREAIAPAREEDAVAGALWQRATLERDRLDLEDQAARADVTRLKAELERIGADQAREQQMSADATDQVQALRESLAQLEKAVADAPERAPALQAEVDASEARRREADAEVERLTGLIATFEAEATAARARRQDAETRLGRLQRTLEASKGERDSLQSQPVEGLGEARAELERAVEALRHARATLESGEEARTLAAQDEGEARERARRIEDRLGRLQTEARGLSQLLQGSRREHPAVLDQVLADKGYEAALAAALGDDLEAALDPRASAHWGGRTAPSPDLPEGAVRLSDHVRAPDALRARLDHCAVVERSRAEALIGNLGAGLRLVTREGDLYRWDGYVSRADAPRPAAVRLGQRARLAELERDIDTLKPELESAQADHKAAIAALREAQDALASARKAPQEAERAIAVARDHHDALARQQTVREARLAALSETLATLEAEQAEAERAFAAMSENQPASETLEELRLELAAARQRADTARAEAGEARAARDAEARERALIEGTLDQARRDLAGWERRLGESTRRQQELEQAREATHGALDQAARKPEEIEQRRLGLADTLAMAERRRAEASDALQALEARAAEAERVQRSAEQALSTAREARGVLGAHAESATARLAETERHLRDTARMSPEELGERLQQEAIAKPTDAAGAEALIMGLEREREALGAVNLRAEDEAGEYGGRLEAMRSERADLTSAIARLRDGIDELNAEGRDRLVAAFDVINTNFKTLFETLFGGGQAELKLVESDDPLEAGLEIYACPPGKRLSVMSLMSGGEQALTAAALIFAVFLANPAPVCVLDEVDAPLDDANVDRFCRMLDEMRKRTHTRFIVITHNPVTMSRMDRLYGVTMPEQGVSQLVSVDLTQAEKLVA